jgi:hypothetical protein
MMSGGISVSNTYAGSTLPQMKLHDLTSFGNKGIITGVKVMWSNHIVGLELLFNGQSSGLIKGSHSHDVWEENFSLNQGDYIVGVYGRFTNEICCLGFKTAKGMTKTWGNPLDGEGFTFGLNGQYIKALKIGVTDYLNFLEPVYDEEVFLTAKRLEFSNNGKFTSLLGHPKSNSEQFDDWDWLSSKFNYAVAEVKIWHDGKHVHGVQFSYNLDGTKKSPGKHCTEFNGLRCESLILEDNEHITKILIRAGEWIDQISFYTDHGRSLKAGGIGGTPFLTVVPDGHHFVAVAGATSNHMDSLQFFFDEIY